MKRYRQLEDVLVADFVTDRWEHPVHSHNHYELIYIKYGSGVHHINGVSTPYKETDIFLLGPEEEHAFDIATRTRFVYIKFTDAYIYQKENAAYDEVQHLEYLLKSRETHLSAFRLSEEDANTAALVFDVVISLKRDIRHNESLIRMQLLSLSILLQRNMAEIRSTVGRNKDMQALFCYIHKHIYMPDRLRSAVMAEHFHLAEAYVGPYFKRNTGLSLRDYIRDYRVGLIRKRMDSGKYSLKEIAADFGLTDESHVSKLLREGRAKC
ncbi:AraC family transcriptional regulator [Puia sp.]|jgi:AraC-like DNA-binding protein|uniref:AraC family transcriptional regulator n=1 Tax=Puia sp. TaxID=2045100 RepID=UPI002F3ED746